MNAYQNILALETSTEQLSVALAVPGQIATRAFADNVPHSERILDVVQSLLAEAGISVCDLHGIGFGAGPGAFTGVRLGCGVAQGIALARSIPVVAVNSLCALAQSCCDRDALDQQHFMTITDARLGEVYFAAWSGTSGAWREAVPTGLAAPQSLIAPAGGVWRGCGSGFGLYADQLRARMGSRLSDVQAAARPDAQSVLAITRAMLEAGRGVPPEEALPLYIRDKVAMTTAERAARAASR